MSLERLSLGIGRAAVAHKHTKRSWRLAANGKGLERSIAMPGGVWLNPVYHNYDMLYGSTFVIQRERFGGPGLVLSNRKADMIQVWVPTVKGKLVTSVPPGALQHVPAMHLLPEPRDGETSGSYGSECSGCTAMVLAGQESRGDEESLGSVSPRRTQKMRFTCDRCGTVNTNFVNPHAWEEGTVFCRCEGCQQVHLIRDEKGTFWIPARNDNDRKSSGKENAIDIPSGLAQKPPVDKTVGGVELL